MTYISSVDDLPSHDSGNVITLGSNTAYVFAGAIDLLGNRLVCGRNTTLLGLSSEISSITSTGLADGNAMISSQYSMPMQNITIRSGSNGNVSALNLRANEASQALDMLFVNFSGCANVGTINEYENFIYTQGAFLNSANLVFGGNISTCAINSSLLSGIASSNSAIITFPATARINRRFRMVYSSVVVPSSSVGVSVHANAVVANESYILDTVNFAGAGTKTDGVTASSEKALFTHNVGITNTSANGQMYMQANGTATTGVNPNFAKVAGVTTASDQNAKFSHSDNRLTCTAAIRRKYLIQVALSYTTTNGNEVEIGLFDSTLNDVRVPSRITSTAGSNGRAENLSTFCVVDFGDGDYLEVHIRNVTANNAITVDQMNVALTELGD